MDEAFVKKILRECGLTFLQGVVRGEKVRRTYVAFAKDAEGNKFVLKVLISDREVDQDEFLREVAFLRLMREDAFRGITRFIQELVDSQVEKPPFWELKKFVVGELAGGIVSDFGWKEELLVPQFKEELLTFLEQMSLLDVERIAAGVPRIKVPDLDRYFTGSFRVLDSEVEELIGEKKLQRILQGFDKQQEMLLKPRMVLCHSDLYPNNVIRVDKCSFTVIDWDHIIWCNPALDIVFLWAMGWKNPAWQQSFLEGVHQRLRYPTNEFTHVFNLMKIYLSVRLLSHGVVMYSLFKKQGEEGKASVAQRFIRVQERNISCAAEEVL